VWWTSYVANGGVLRAPLAGGAVEVFATEANGALGLLVDGSNVYWTADGVVKKRAITDGPGDGTAISQPHTAPGILASDGTYLYFGEFADPGDVIRLDPTTGEEFVLASGQHNADGVAAAGDGYLLFTSFAQDGSVSWADTKQGGSHPVKEHQGLPTTVAVSGDFAYWPSFGDGTVNRVLWSTGGTVTTLASNQASPNGIAVDDTHVYWTNYDPDGAVMRAKK
jgi:sugar lactone lactonase YvrE